MIEQDKLNLQKDNRLEKNIGTKEPEKLKPKPVICVSASIEVQKKKDGKTIIGDKLILFVEHPDQDDPIQLSKTKYIKGDDLKESGLWYKEDEEGFIQKGSALSDTMNFYDIKTIKGFIGKKLETVSDKDGYLCVKAY